MNDIAQKEGAEMINPFKFSGKAMRQEYWGWLVVTYIIMGIAGYAFIVGVDFNPNPDFAAIFMLLTFLFVFVACQLAILATSVRRIRDAGLVLWWAPTNLAPLLFMSNTLAQGSGWAPTLFFVPLIVFGVLPSDKGDRP